MGLQILKSFSERQGLKKIRTEIQLESMDTALRNRLWNVLDLYYWSKATVEWSAYGDEMASETNTLMTRLWHFFYKEPVDMLHARWSENYKLLRRRFFEAEWYEVYDFIEFVARQYPDEAKNNAFMKTCNKVLEAELSGYRFVGSKITQVTSENEISEIEKALETPLKNVNAHLENALNLMSDRKSPDFRNSIKESISAVEALCRLVTIDNCATLGKALDAIEREGKIELHGALKKAFDSLYGYTSTAEGIRHALLDDKVSVGFEDAKFMLVSCSAFVNYLLIKASKAGMKLE
jgi:hypothetical protein